MGCLKPFCQHSKCSYVWNYVWDGKVSYFVDVMKGLNDNDYIYTSKFFIVPNTFVSSIFKPI
ncbi:hypothetical protein PIROE2DRAFT_18703 [Piromyces sp. E2]|nr:hypothetical protein PIROE2DRAFT_18703 [Piromyces sp. E2]|eukprot:OUM56603.1 hypothetical protein PIROE2DRAFT_18703 [Piromyces sp. E2]